MRFAQGTDMSPGSPARAQLDQFTALSRGNKPKAGVEIGGGADFYNNQPKQPINVPERPKAQPVMDTPVVSQPRPATPANCPPAAKPPRMAGQQLEANTPAKPKADVQAQPVVTPRQEAEVQLEQAAATGANTDKPKAALENIIKQEIDVKQDAIDMEFIRRCGNEVGVACVKPGPGERPAFDYSKFRDQLMRPGQKDTNRRPGDFLYKQAKGPTFTTGGPRIQPVESGPRATPVMKPKRGEKPIDPSRREPIWQQLQARNMTRRKKRGGRPIPAGVDEIATTITQLRQNIR